MTTPLIVISSDEEDVVEKPVVRMRPRQKTAPNSRKTEFEIALKNPVETANQKASAALAPRSKTAEISPSRNTDRRKISKRAVSVPPLDHSLSGKTTGEGESYVKSRKHMAAIRKIEAAVASSLASTLAGRQDSPDVVITGSATRCVDQPQPRANRRQIDQNYFDQSVPPISPSESVSNRRVPTELQDYASDASSTTLFNATAPSATPLGTGISPSWQRRSRPVGADDINAIAVSTTPVATGISSSWQRRRPLTISRPIGAHDIDDGYAAAVSPHDDGENLSLAGPEMEYPWPPPPSWDNTPAPDHPYYYHQQDHYGYAPAEEQIQGPYFSAPSNPSHHLNGSNPDLFPSVQQAHPSRLASVQPHMEPSYQVPFVNPKRKPMSSPVEQAPTSKRTRKSDDPDPTATTPYHYHQQQQPSPPPLRPQSLLPFQHHLTLGSTASGGGDDINNIPNTNTHNTTTHRPRSRPWTKAMIADMAQTLEIHFPFEQFSNKHGKPCAEVFEAFKAVVQMPLIEYSAKGMTRARMPEFHERIRVYREKEKETVGLRLRMRCKGNSGIVNGKKAVMVPTSTTTSTRSLISTSTSPPHPFSSSSSSYYQAPPPPPPPPPTPTSTSSALNPQVIRPSAPAPAPVAYMRGGGGGGGSSRDGLGRGGLGGGLGGGLERGRPGPGRSVPGPGPIPRSANQNQDRNNSTSNSNNMMRNQNQNQNQNQNPNPRPEHDSPVLVLKNGIWMLAN